MEILSPASNLEHIKVAIDHNANAVYGGLKNWNARNKAVNFSIKEYNYIINKLHKNNIKFYLTLNILMLDQEIKDVVTFLKNNKLPDAFISTDLGLIRILQKEFPTVPIHFSTQFGCHNIDDVNYVKSLGGTRVILARELTLDEINKISKNTDLELECFIWGSQCLSFSGLCFFGTLINGGGGNRGKCIITCRDLYSVNNDYGHYMYVPDMDCINLKSKLNNVECLKIEGRRRPSKEIEKVLDSINNDILSKKNVGYLFGTKFDSNNLYEKINSRIEPVIRAKNLDEITKNDVCIEFDNGVPLKISNDYENPNVQYVYTEIKNDYIINKKNIMIDFSIEDNLIIEALLVDHNGNGRTFYGENNNLVVFDFKCVNAKLKSINSDINIYKIKYKRGKKSKLLISSKLLNEIEKYIIDVCKSKSINIKKNKFKFNKLFIETNNLLVIREFINNKNIRLIYNIETIKNLKNIKNIINEFSDMIIYKLPLFNWKSDDLSKYLELLNNKEIMFTRFSQIYQTKNIKFKKKYADYTIYIWNKETLKYLEENGVNEFTASPELSVDTNNKIFKNQNVQFILGGKLPMVYTRNCFKNVFNCKNCLKNKNSFKNIHNEDKNLEFEILCNDEYRYVLNKNPILNDYTLLNMDDTISYRYCSLGHSIEEIKTIIDSFENENYYEYLKRCSAWENSYECNLIEGKE